ncbi:Signal transduction histidine kinase CheA [Methylophaga frappieri]|uniref:Chemotaxis protein CheA n=1 Tax=Methylophaga frappieri (strain ATCC BAA-2434 / DSM 25690 / JAM7) TaxID=754477 RepID=I1YJ16_METFJ|nr:Hpt domain-containing protein [Methylophaga frappieri]AFJ02909.1 Signal transduction histidine kinase CheA [Methylophaga frappieri]
MAIETTGNYTALQWVQAELQQALASALRSVQHYLDTSDSAALSDTIEQLYQTHGTLQMLDLDGARQCTAEMQAVCQQLRDRPGEQVEEATSALIRALLLLPEYLQQLDDIFPDHLICLLPLINALRSVRSVPALDDLACFQVPDQPAVPEGIRPDPLQSPPAIDISPNQLARAYQHLLLTWLRQQDDSSLKKMRGILHYLRLVSQHEQTTRLWWCAEAFLEALLQKGLENFQAESRTLLGKLVAPIKIVSEQNPNALLAVFPDSLLKQLMLMVAKANSHGPLISHIKQHYGLSFYDQQQTIFGVSRTAQSDAIKGVLEELQRIKDEVSEIDPTTSDLGLQLNQLTPQIDTLAETLVMLNQMPASQILRTQQQQLAMLSEKTSPEQTEGLAALADILLDLEKQLRTGINQSDTETQQLNRVVLQECLLELANLKESLTLAGQHQQIDSTLMAQMTATLKQLNGSLVMLNHPEAADLLDAAERRLATETAESITTQKLQDLADILVASELYMESLQQHGRADSMLLANAKQTLEHFGEQLHNDDSAEAESVSEPRLTGVEHYLRQRDSMPPETIATRESHERILPLTGVARYLEKQQAARKLTGVERYLQQQASSTVVALTSVERYLQQKMANDDHALDALTSATQADSQDLSTAASQDELDDEIAAVFLEEANDVLNLLAQHIPHWQLTADPVVLAEIRRHFHTLKGSGRMAAATAVAETAWSIEDLLNAVLSGLRLPHHALLSVVQTAQTVVADLIALFEQGNNTLTPSAATLIAEANALRSGAPQTIDVDPKLSARPLTGVERYLLNPPVRTAPPSETSVTRYIREQQNALATADHGHDPIEPPADISEDDELRQIFLGEARQHLFILMESAMAMRVGDAMTEAQLNAAHSLKGCANIAGVTPVALIATDLDQMLRECHRQQRRYNSQQLHQLQQIYQNLSQLVELTNDGSELPDISLLHQQIEQHCPEKSLVDDNIIVLDPQQLVSFLEETDSLLDQYTRQLTTWQQSGQDEQKQSLNHILRQLADHAESAGISPLAALYQLLDGLIQHPQANHSGMSALLDQGYELLNNQIEALIQHQPMIDLPSFRDEINQFLHSLETATSDLSATEPVTSITPQPENDYDATDPELLSAFTEEALELLQSANEAIRLWQQVPDHDAVVMQLQRDLHTLKGGARMTNLAPMATLTHQTESLVMHVTQAKPTKVGEDFFDLLQRCHDQLSVMQEQLQARQPMLVNDSLLAEIVTFTTDAVPDQTDPVVASTSDSTKPDEIMQPSMPQASEQIRVRASLLDYLSNFAGEVSISRDRVSQQHRALRQQLGEMEETVSRLHEQLRKLEIETETQILFRYEEGQADHLIDFDPLELDRFSTIQQLSRGLTESVIDLNDISRSMENLVRETDTILLQQSRLNSDLQQGLMHTRLVPFSHVVPRLERIVRQSANELGKTAQLVVDGEAHELDRAMLDRLVAPLEHILRNALAHGIETAQTRQQLGKPDNGQLQITLAREGAEIVIQVSDDGQGLNIDKIREKALALKLIDPRNMPSDDLLMQYILTSGFSTADSVSQLAGRGVGMDVVNNEIRALKGRLLIASQQGQGTTFNIRLPLTLSLTQALLVSASGQQYAIPLSNVNAGERLPAADIQTLLTQDRPVYRFEGEDYQFFPLSHLFDAPLNLPDKASQPMPLLLFRSGLINIALLVDRIEGNREIVIKPVGRQLSQIAAINGATILGDGRVVLILDIPTLIEAHQQQTSSKLNALQARLMQTAEAAMPLALIVDDSITMRKASGKFMSRQGFQVITAKDGIEALALLHEKSPDIILLDVEMPRMDGFEFASIVRNDHRFQHLPVIMITSRTGDKHKQRALAIGVNDYLGKPYQENELIAVMKSLLGQRYPASHSEFRNS